MDNFDLKKYLAENKITANSKILNEAPENLDISDVISMLPTDEDAREQLKNGYMGFDETSIYLEQGFEHGVRWVRETLMEKLRLK
jgi:hypothetical protein